MNLDEASAALIGAAVGAGAGLLGSLITGWHQSRIEEKKWQRAQQDRVGDDIREATAGLARILASCAHSMMWSTYKVLTTMKITKEEVYTYEIELHHAIANMVSSQMQIAVLDHAVYQRVTPMVSEAIKLGAETFLSLKAALEDVRRAEADLSACNAKSLDFIKRVPSELADLLQS